MKTLLVQLRDDPWTLEWDKKNFVAATELPEESLTSLNVFDHEIRITDIDGYDAVIIGGSKFGVYDAFPHKDALKSVIRKIAETNAPLLGICFGAQCIADALGGAVMADEERQEFGTYIIERTDPDLEDPLFADVPKKFLAQASHHDRITRLPSGSVILAKSEKCPIHAFKIIGANIYGVQFHPERSKEAFAEMLQREMGETPPDKQAEKNPPLKKVLKSLKASDTYGIVKNFLKIAGDGK